MKNATVIDSLIGGIEAEVVQVNKLGLAKVVGGRVIRHSENMIENVDSQSLVSGATPFGIIGPRSDWY